MNTNLVFTLIDSMVKTFLVHNDRVSNNIDYYIYVQEYVYISQRETNYSHDKSIEWEGL